MPGEVTVLVMFLCVMIVVGAALWAWNARLDVREQRAWMNQVLDRMQAKSLQDLTMRELATATVAPDEQEKVKEVAREVADALSTLSPDSLITDAWLPDLSQREVN